MDDKTKDKVASLIDDWFNRQVKYEETASNAEKWQHEIRFNAKAQATRDCWKELQELMNES